MKDPDGMNADRARWANTALACFMELTGTDECDALTDLLCDLMHRCENIEEFEASLAMARMHFEQETT